MPKDESSKQRLTKRAARIIGRLAVKDMVAGYALLLILLDEPTVARFILDHNILELQSHYSAPITDCATVTTTFWFKGHYKTIEDYADSGPAELRQAERLIDGLLAATRWDQPVTSSPNEQNAVTTSPATGAISPQ